MPIDMEYYEAFGNPPAPECWVSIDIDEPFYEATARALPYKPSPDGDAQRRVVPLVWIEMAGRKSKADNPAIWPRSSFLTRCMDLAALGTLIEAMIDEDLIEPQATDAAGATVHVFADTTEYAIACDSKVHALKAVTRAG